MKTVKTNEPFQFLLNNMGLMIQTQADKITCPYIWNKVEVTGTDCFTTSEGDIYTPTNETKTIGDDTYYGADYIGLDETKPETVWCEHNDYAQSNGLFVVETVEEVETFVLYGIIRKTLNADLDLRDIGMGKKIYSFDLETEYYTDGEVKSYVFDEDNEIVGYVETEATEVEETLTNAAYTTPSAWEGKYEWHGTTDASHTVSVWTDERTPVTNDKAYLILGDENEYVEITSSSKPLVDAQVTRSYDGVNYADDGAAITSETDSWAIVTINNIPRGAYFKVESEDEGLVTICGE